MLLFLSALYLFFVHLSLFFRVQPIVKSVYVMRGKIALGESLVPAHYLCAVFLQPSNRFAYVSIIHPGLIDILRAERGEHRKLSPQ
jgi:hypothetical protein